MLNSSSQYPIVDKEIVSQMRRLAPDRKWLLNLYVQFDVQTHEQLAQLKDALEVSDKKACLFLFHAMKSSAYQVGAAQFAKLLEDWESALVEERQPLALEIHQQLDVHFVKFSETIKDVLSQEKGRA